MTGRFHFMQSQISSNNEIFIFILKTGSIIIPEFPIGAGNEVIIKSGNSWPARVEDLNFEFISDFSIRASNLS